MWFWGWELFWGIGGSGVLGFRLMGRGFRGQCVGASRNQ